MAKRGQHEWGFMANEGSNGLGELAQCQVKSCGLWSYLGAEGRTSKPFKMAYQKYVEMHQSGEIDATECLGLPTSK